MTHKNEAPDGSGKKIPDGFDDFFAALTVEMGKPSASEQSERLRILTDRFRGEWSASGLLTKLYDATPADLTDGDMQLRRVMLRNADGLDVTELYVHVAKTERITEDSNRVHSKSIPVAQELGGLVMPAVGGRFDDSDAELVFRQAAEIDALRASGVLPDVSANLISISDPSRSIAVRNPAKDA